MQPAQPGWTSPSQTTCSIKRNPVAFQQSTSAARLVPVSQVVNPVKRPKIWGWTSEGTPSPGELVQQLALPGIAEAAPRDQKYQSAISSSMGGKRCSITKRIHENQKQHRTAKPTYGPLSLYIDLFAIPVGCSPTLPTTTCIML